MLMVTYYVVDLSIPRGFNIYKGQTNRRNEQFTNIPIVGVLLH
jgi:hypothetical protein